MKKNLIIFSLLTFLTINSFGQATGVVYPDYPTGGTLGRADTTIDVIGLININQTTSGQTITMPTPTNTLAGKNITINNIGTTPFKLVPGGYVMPGTGLVYRWTGSAPTGLGWSITGAGMVTADESQNTFYAAPIFGSGTPGFRTIDGSDLPSIPASKLPISLTTTGSSGAATYNSSTGGLNIPNYSPSVTFNSSPGRTLSTTGSNNTFTISTTKNARVNYTINFSFALTLTTSNGLVTLDYSTDGGTTWTTVSSVSNVYSVSVTLSGNTDTNLSGEIPANALVRIYRSSNTNVTVTLPTTKQQEVTY